MASDEKSKWPVNDDHAWAVHAFTAKWGFGPPSDRHKWEYDADLATVKFLEEYGADLPTYPTES